jgi:hypothetical protein
VIILLGSYMYVRYIVKCWVCMYRQPAMAPITGEVEGEGYLKWSVACNRIMLNCCMRYRIPTLSHVSLVADSVLRELTTV